MTRNETQLSASEPNRLTRGANPPRGRCHFHGSFWPKALSTAGGLALSSRLMSLADTFSEQVRLESVLKAGDRPLRPVLSPPDASGRGSDAEAGG